MKLSVALFFAGLFGALAAVFILLSFGTDYWLLASERCHPNPNISDAVGVVPIEVGVGLEQQHMREAQRIICFHFVSLHYPVFKNNAVNVQICNDHRKSNHVNWLEECLEINLKLKRLAVYLNSLPS